VSFELRLGSCLDPVSGLASLADKSVDVVITDPPYEDEAHTLQRRQKGASTRPGGNQEFREVREAALTFAAISAGDRVAVAAQAARITKQRALAFCQAEAIGAWREAFDAADMPYRRSLVWCKPDAMPSLHGRWPGQATESIVLAQHRSAKSCPIGGKAKWYESSRDHRGRGAVSPHPTTKPLELMLAIVADFTEPGDLVCDPFAGSGTTGVACLRLGRRFLGWELSPEYHAIALRRLRGEEAKPRPEQPGLFDSLGGAA